MVRLFYKGSHAVILVYDVTSYESFRNVHEWKKEIEEHADDGIVVYLVANQIDKEQN